MKDTCKQIKTNHTHNLQTLKYTARPILQQYHQKMVFTVDVWKGKNKSL